MHNLLSKLLLLLAGSVVAVSAFAATPKIELRGELTQGALIVGKTQPGTSISLNGVALTQTPAGEFVFGFGRDAALEQQLVLEFPSGEQVVRKLTLQPREYRIERVDGVPPATVNPDPEQVARSQADAQKVRAARATRSARTDFLTPILSPAAGRFSGFYGSQRILNGEPRQPHFGLDVAAPTGTPVVAPWPGRVVLAVPDMFFSGGTLIIDHGYGVTTTYIHLDKIWVEVGQTIAQGERVADIGATGRVTGPHLDWRVNWQDERLDPNLLPTLFNQQPFTEQ